MDTRQVDCLNNCGEQAKYGIYPLRRNPQQLWLPVISWDVVAQTQGDGAEYCAECAKKISALLNRPITAV